MPIRPMEWADDHLRLLDQRRLPVEEVWLELRTWEDVRDAIRDMAVRGAPAIGLAAAYGLALAARAHPPLPRRGRGGQGGEGAPGPLREARDGLAASRPTAVNLHWALERVMALPTHHPEAVLAEARAIEGEDLEMNRAIGAHGATLVPAKARILTVCNTGSLATAGYGTALGIVRAAHAEGKVEHVYACETRPRLQGLRLTAWELLRERIPFQAIADGAAASLMRAGRIDLVIVGADRIAANGDTANKIGTYALAVCARHHRIPFVVAAPGSTLDRALASGEGIPIEERDASELTEIEGVRVAPEGCPVFNPAFDVTPSALVTAIVTDRGVHRPPYRFE